VQKQLESRQIAVAPASGTAQQNGRPVEIDRAGRSVFVIATVIQSS
jgi:hypothetical protein